MDCMVRVSLSREIDVKHLGRERVICAHEVEGFIVDPGPAVSVETLLEAIGGEQPRGLLLTHIHLDHAGATGVLVRRFPELEVYVHERGAPHLIDPSKLIKSAGQIYGDQMERLWGEIVPVPEANINLLSGGERLDDFLVEYTPGHASHHVCYLHEPSREAFVGDVAGVRIPPYDLTLAPTPPPDIDVEAWEQSLDLFESWEPTVLCLTHFGRVENATQQVEDTRAALHRQAEAVRKTDDEAAFTATMVEEVESALDADAAAAFMQALPPHHIWMGLERYWRKRAERERPDGHEEPTR